METRKKEIITVPGLVDTRPFGYAQCVTAGNLVFVAGQAGVDERFAIVSPEFALQARQALENVGRALEAVGTSMANVIAMTVQT